MHIANQQSCENFATRIWDSGLSESYLCGSDSSGGIISCAGLRILQEFRSRKCVRTVLCFPEQIMSSRLLMILGSGGRVKIVNWLRRSIQRMGTIEPFAYNFCLLTPWISSKTSHRIMENSQVLIEEKHVKSFSRKINRLTMTICWPFLRQIQYRSRGMLFNFFEMNSRFSKAIQLNVSLNDKQIWMSFRGATQSWSPQNETDMTRHQGFCTSESDVISKTAEWEI